MEKDKETLQQHFKHAVLRRTRENQLLRLEDFWIRYQPGKQALDTVWIVNDKRLRKHNYVLGRDGREATELKRTRN